MTHDELIESINKEIDEAAFTKYTPVKHLQALRAVVEVHKPEGDKEQQCEHDKKIYPCPTIQAIEKELA
jgi:hypothetical protein